MAEWRGDGVWHLWIDATPRPGFANMSVDLTLLDRTERYGERWLRLYGWQPSCLSFGRHEPAARRYDRERIQQLGLDTVRRPTGGRAVWHARELTYAITTPTDGFGSSRFAYLEIHRLILDALGRLGVAGTLAPAVRTAGVGAGSCFARPAGGEVLVDGRKVVGSAQLCRGSGLLQHGSILLEHTQHLVESLKSVSTCGTAGLSAPVHYPLGRPVAIDALTDAVADTAACRWGGTWNRRKQPDEVLQAASQYFPQFESAEWTWTR